MDRSLRGSPTIFRDRVRGRVGKDKDEPKEQIPGGGMGLGVEVLRISQKEW